MTSLRREAEALYAKLNTPNHHLDAIDIATIERELTVQRVKVWEEAAKYCDDCEAAERKFTAQSNAREFILAFHKVGYWCRQRKKELE